MLQMVAENSSKWLNKTKMKTSKIVFNILAVVMAVCLCTACKHSSGGPEPAVESELTINGLSDSVWVYFSVSKGDVVGTSTFLSESEDAEWANRKDWDFAICGDYIKTNSGASGNGRGGILRDSEHNFQTLTEAPAEGYIIDAEGIVK